jgi:hypothetical protein
MTAADGFRDTSSSSSSSSSSSLLEVQTALESYMRRIRVVDDYTAVLVSILAPLISSPNFDEDLFAKAIAAEMVNCKNTTG